MSGGAGRAPAPIIVGAGLAGLIAAHAWPRAPVVEAAPEPTQAHRALLRFRSDLVARLTGVEFRRVRVRKGIWSRGEFVAPSIGVANAYARKVTGRLAGERSIWNIDAVDRYVAPESLYEQLVDAVAARISWGTRFAYADGLGGGERHASPVVSTAPLPLTRAAARIAMPAEGVPEFSRAPIEVWRFRLPRGTDVHQTVYLPDHDTGVYRASITGDLLIVEGIGVGCPRYTEDEVVETACAPFGIDPDSAVFVEERRQHYGKILPIDESVRKELVWRLTHERNIFSLGRFATWRNILLDDVVDDIETVRKLMLASQYDLKIASR